MNTVLQQIVLIWYRDFYKPEEKVPHEVLESIDIVRSTDKMDFNFDTGEWEHAVKE